MATGSRSTPTVGPSATSAKRSPPIPQQRSAIGPRPANRWALEPAIQLSVACSSHLGVKNICSALANFAVAQLAQFDLLQNQVDSGGRYQVAQPRCGGEEWLVTLADFAQNRGRLISNEPFVVGKCGTIGHDVLAGQFGPRAGYERSKT